VINKAKDFFAEAQHLREHFDPDFKSLDKFVELDESLGKYDKIIVSYFEFH